MTSADRLLSSRKIVITEFDRENNKVKATGFGEPFDIQKHPQVGSLCMYLLQPARDNFDAKKVAHESSIRQGVAPHAVVVGLSGLGRRSV